MFPMEKIIGSAVFLKNKGAKIASLLGVFFYKEGGALYEKNLKF